MDRDTTNSEEWSYMVNTDVQALQAPDAPQPPQPPEVPQAPGVPSRARAKLYSPAFLFNPYRQYAKLREKSPVYPVSTPLGFDTWMITRYEDVKAIALDPRFSRDPGMTRPEVQMITGDITEARNHSLLSIDPPAHTRVRKLVQQGFGARRRDLGPSIVRIVDELLDKLAEVGEIDFVEDVAYQLPVSIICELLGVPAEERGEFRQWTRWLSIPAAGGSYDKLRDAQSRLQDYLEDLIRRKRQREGEDDLLAALIAARDDGDQLTEEELVGNTYLLLLAGHETTVTLLASTTYLLLAHPDQWEMVKADRSLIGSAIEESLRYEAPAGVSVTCPLEDVEIAGTVIPAGEVVTPVIHSANRDERQFERADQFDITRKDNAHLSFGHGIHACLGAALARQEGRVLIDQLMTRFPNLQLGIDAARAPWRPAPFIRALESLPVAAAG